MAATDGGYVALADTRVQLGGLEDCQTQALWHSPDAKTWDKVWQNPTDCKWFSARHIFAIDGDLYAMGNEGQFIAIGRTFDEREDRIWVSGNAQTWILADIPSEQLADVFPFQAAATDETVIALATEVVPAVRPTNFHTWLTTTGDHQP